MKQLNWTPKPSEAAAPCLFSIKSMAVMLKRAWWCINKTTLNIPFSRKFLGLELFNGRNCRTTKSFMDGEAEEDKIIGDKR